MKGEQLLSAYWAAHRKNKLASLTDLFHERPRELSEISVADFVSNVLKEISKGADELSMPEGTYEMANVRPDKTGLPFIVYISEKGSARHAARVKVAPGPRANHFTASVTVQPDVVVVEGTLGNQDLDLLTKWIDLNRKTIMDYWTGVIAYTEDALAALKPIGKK